MSPNSGSLSPGSALVCLCTHARSLLSVAVSSFRVKSYSFGHLSGRIQNIASLMAFGAASGSMCISALVTVSRG